jgi:Holliday junction resolvase RusA-like endonuclease
VTTSRAEAPAFELTVWGIPAPKGSKSAFSGHRKDGSHFAAVKEGKTERQRDWARRIEEVVQSMAETGARPVEGPLVLEVTFFLPRPKTAPKTKRTYPAVRPDLSKYLRAIEDPMSGILIHDDGQIVEAHVRKDYAVYTGDERPRAEVRVWRLLEPPAGVPEPLPLASTS